MKADRTKEQTKKETIHILIENINNDSAIERIYKLVAYLYRNEADY